VLVVLLQQTLAAEVVVEVTTQTVVLAVRALLSLGT
jgi:hypothetical protein